MTILAAALVAIGVADLIPRHRYALTAALAALLVVTALVTPHSVASWVVLAVEVVGVTAWILLRTVPRGREWLPLTVLGATVATPVLCAPWISVTRSALLDDLLRGGQGSWRWFEADRAILVGGLFLIMLATGNTIVRLVLAAVGATPPERSHRPDPSKTLKGGRILGPLERVFILGLGLAGQFTAAGLVIAAKGLIRWPELTAQADPHHVSPGPAAHGEPDPCPPEAVAAGPLMSPDEEASAAPNTQAMAEEAEPAEPPTRRASIEDITEYFLVGSFVSWLVALTALVIAHP